MGKNRAQIQQCVNLLQILLEKAEVPEVAGCEKIPTDVHFPIEKRKDFEKLEDQISNAIL
jgi:hypothetical protein